MSNILTINPGSTAVKYVVFDGKGIELQKRIFDRKNTLEISKEERDWLVALSDIKSVGIRIVHGGELHGPIFWSSYVEKQVKKFAKFAPIHNNLALGVVTLIREIYEDIVIVASFDTDFHKPMPDSAHTYPIKKQLAEKYDIKRYGFHGLALESVLAQLKNQLSTLPKRVICAHVGGGTSLTAVLNGESVDTTMGLTPLEGPMMITRSGSVDPSIVAHLSEMEGVSPLEIVDMLNNESGLYGLTGSKNTLDIINRASKRQEPEKLAFDIFVNQIVKQIFAYYGTLQGCDALVLSGGIGYGNAYLQAKLLEKLKIIGIKEQNTFVYQANEAKVLLDNVKEFLG